MRYNRWIFTIMSITVVVTLCIWLFAYPQQMATETNQRIAEDDELNTLIKGLWSVNEQERNVAKNKLLQLGQKAVAPLIVLLEDVTSISGPRFATGKETEGAEAWRRFHSTPSDQQNVQDMRKLMELEITWRLKQDAIDLLGWLEAKEAVPLLVRLMSTDGMVLSKKNAEMQALVRIGPAAVPKLIEVIETPDETLASVDYWLGPSHKNSEGPRISRFIPRFIKSRAIIVLGRIGDPRALPVLEDLLLKTKEREIIESLQDAIKKIRRPT